MEQICENVPNFVEEEVVCQFGDNDEFDSPQGEGKGYAHQVDGSDERNEDYDNLLTQVHPLHNHVILTHMFQLCPQENLATFRQVSKLWYKLSLQAWRSTVTVNLDAEDLHIKGRAFFWEAPLPKLATPIILRILHSDSDYPNNLPILKRTDIYSTILQKFTYYIKEPDHDHIVKPFRKFCLEGWEMRDWNEQISQFVQLCGPFMTTLELRNCLFPDITTFRDVLFKWFPSLKKLTIMNIQCRWFVNPVEEPKSYQPPQRGLQKNLIYLEMDMNHEQLPISWMELFSHYSNLKTFKLFNADVDETVEPMLKAIKIIRKHDPRKLQLKHLDLLQASLYAQDRISPEVCLLLRDLKLALESLTIDIGVHRDGKKLEDILQWHAATLRKLNIYRGPISFPYQDFPFGVQLDSLQEIVMSDRLSESLTFLRYTPNLAKLKICDVGDIRAPTVCSDIVKNTDARVMKTVKLEKCKELHFDYVITLKEMEILVACLPNVEKLRIPISDDGQFRLICEKWQHCMSDMELLGDNVDDCTITGLQRTQVCAINEVELNNKEWEIEDDDNDNFDAESLSSSWSEEKPVVVPQHINITALKQLRKFKMGNEEVYPTNLMDCSAIYGFLKLPKLEYLYISSQMCDRSRNALFAKIPDCTIVRTRCPTIDSDGWETDSD